MDERRALNVRLSDEAMTGWENYCAEQGVTLTSMLEVVGRALARREAVTDNADYTQTEEFRRILMDARRLTAESRRRRPRG